jgi:adsorption protein B
LVLASLAVACLFPLGLYILASALDDLILDGVCWSRWWRQGWRPRAGAPPVSKERPIAIWIPLWQESDVIAQMLEHNLSAIAYRDYDVFVGCYPNDAATLSAVRLLEARHASLHVALVPHDGPTSKADCLNWIFQHMAVWEEKHGRRFEVVVIHDAEDLVHPSALGWISHWAESHDMIQMPVLPLRTPWREWTHGLYCDDFAESQGKDLESRVDLGGFLPGCGVGTALRRDLLDHFARADSNRVFSPSCLTEDYDLGVRIHKLGRRQVFVPLCFEWDTPVATREYFPRTRVQAVRQRSRWVTGNVFQAWERHGWGAGSWREAWFFWRDRKGLWGNPISLLCNALLFYGLVSWGASAALGVPWRLGAMVRESSLVTWLLWLNTALLAARVGTRVAASARIYGWLFSLGVPPRMIWGNWINSQATFRALAAWLRCRIRREPLVWVKTEHVYPSRFALREHKRRLGEVLVANGYCSQQQVEEALATRGQGMRIGERLVEMGAITETELYEALSLQQSIPCVQLNNEEIPRRVARAFPAPLIKAWEVLPFRIENGSLLVAGTQVPTDQMQSEMQKFTRLEIRFHFVTPSELEAARQRLL